MRQSTSEIPPMIRNMYHAVAKSPMYLPRSPSLILLMIMSLASSRFGRQYLSRSRKVKVKSRIHTSIGGEFSPRASSIVLVGLAFRDLIVLRAFADTDSQVDG
jgi:hypothetical protein